MNIKEAMKKAKETRQPQQVTEGLPEKTNAKVNISIRLDLELLEWLKAEAKLVDIPYQTFTNSLLKRAMATQIFTEELKKIQLEDHEHRIAELEQRILKRG